MLVLFWCKSINRLPNQMDMITHYYKAIHNSSLLSYKISQAVENNLFVFVIF